MKETIISDLERERRITKGGDRINNVIDILLAAVNDWPTPIEGLNQYETEVEQFIVSPVTGDNIKVALKKIDFSKHSWQGESLSILLDAFSEYQEGTSLNEIIMDVRENYPQL